MTAAHFTLQGPAPHVRSEALHESVPHVIVHEAFVGHVKSAALHEPLPHVISQGRSSAHLKSELLHDPSLQLM